MPKSHTQLVDISTVSSREADRDSFQMELEGQSSQRSFKVLGIPISSLNKAETIDQISTWARQRNATKLVTFTNVHMMTEGLRIPPFREIHAAMDMNCPDGMPLVWLGRTGKQRVTRVCGPEFMEAFFASGSHEGIRHFFYGGSDGVAQNVAHVLVDKYPELKIAGFYSPPFRPLTPEEDAEVVQQINESCADMVWVCLGCPKQEIWIHEHRDKLQVSIILAVGLAFDILAGSKKRAPAIFRDTGLEWLFRLMQEPARLTTRYLKSNAVFVGALVLSLFTRQFD